MKYKVFIDTETGGLSPNLHDVLTLACVIDDENKQTIFSKEWLIKGTRVTEEALNVNKINLIEHNKVAQTIDEVAQELLELFKEKEINDYVIVGQNVMFDIGFITRQIYPQNNTNPFINCFIHDTKQMAQTYKLKNNVDLPKLNLQTLTEHFGMTVNFHNALEDVKATRHVYYSLLERLQK